jgi:hypothetical protein
MVPGATRHSGSGSAAAYSASGTHRPPAPANRSDRRPSRYPARPSGPGRGSTEPVSASDPSGAGAGTVAVTARLMASASVTASRGGSSRTGWPSRSTRIAAVAVTAPQLTVASRACAIAVRARSASDGPGSTSASMPSCLLGKPYLSQ